MQGIYDDAALGDAVGVHRGAVAGWWRGSRPNPDTIRELAEVTGLGVSELSAFVYYEGAPPRLPEPGSAVVSGVQEGIRQDQDAQPVEGPPTPAPSPERRPRGTGAERA